MMALLCAAAALPPGPLKFRADDMRTELKEHRVLLDGDVHLNRADLFVTGDHAVADYADAQKAAPPKKRAAKQPEAKLGGMEVERFTVDGKVHVERGARTADGEHGVMDMPAQTLTLTGTQATPPVLRDGPETLSGERILMRLDSEDVDVVRPRLFLKRSLPAETQKSATTPVKVEADHLAVHKEARLARFSDDVVLRRGDTVAKSPRMDARYDETGQLTTLQMRGGVDLRQGSGRRATGQSADYDARSRTLVLTGDPKLYDRGDVVVGDRIEMALDSKEIHVVKAKVGVHPEAHKDEEAPAP
jgi:lipopolysaccharide transport protein LptA